MGGDEDLPVSLDAMERHLTPPLLATFAQIAEIGGKYCKHQDARLAALWQGKRIPAAATRACEKHRREFATLIGNLHLNNLRIEQLVAQIADLGRRLERGDTTAVVAESRMLPDEVRRIAREIRQNNHNIDRASKELMDANLRLVISIARKYENRGLSFQDLIEAGSAGLRQAIDGFDRERFRSFSIYASVRIRQAIRRALRSNKPPPPGTTIQSNSGGTTARALASLTPREERVLRMRFGDGRHTDHTLKEVGRQLSAPRERIRQIEKKALKTLKEKAGRTGTRPAKALSTTSERRSHEAEIEVFERIDTSRKKTVAAICECPLTMHAIVRWRDHLLQGTLRPRDVIDLKAAYETANYGNGEDGDDGR